MALQIANPEVVAEVAELAVLMGLSKTAAVERAVNEMLATKAKPKHDYFEPLVSGSFEGYPAGRQ